MIPVPRDLLRPNVGTGGLRELSPAPLRVLILRVGDVVDGGGLPVLVCVLDRVRGDDLGEWRIFGRAMVVVVVEWEVAVAVAAAVAAALEEVDEDAAWSGRVMSFLSLFLLLKMLLLFDARRRMKEGVLDLVDAVGVA